VPMVNVVELLRIPAHQIKDRIEKVGDAEVVRLRQELLPIMNLPRLLDLEPQERDEPSPSPSEEKVASTKAMNVVVVSAGSFKYGLIVDELHDSEEIVVKPLDQHLKKIRGYAGATIMGNGQVALILDVSSLARIANLNIEETAAAKAAVEAKTGGGAGVRKTQSLMVFGSSETEKFGVPVDLVGRIERIDAMAVEQIGGKKTIKYRGGILPVHALDEVAHVGPLAERKDLLVIVFEVHGHEFGLLAIAPIDTVDVAVDLDTETLRQPGIKGSAIINGHTTLIVDIREFIGTINPAWCKPEREGAAHARRGSKILYAEDSGFFRSTVKGLLEQEGYSVLDAEDGVDAWRILEENTDDISMVLTDVEMPNLDGIDLSKKIRTDKRFQHIPIVALTTLASDKDIERGKAAGMTEYQVKLDKEHLLASVQQIMGRH